MFFDKEKFLKDFKTRTIELSNGCIVWTGYACDGYGCTWNNNKQVRMHVLAYEHFVGSVDVFKDIDHTCNNRLCCNPLHLEQVTRRENILRSNAPSAINARKTHCPQGHEYTEENTYTPPNSSDRYCRICMKKHKEKYASRNRFKLLTKAKIRKRKGA